MATLGSSQVQTSQVHYFAVEQCVLVWYLYCIGECVVNY
jgi:hypothetical protein